MPHPCSLNRSRGKKRPRSSRSFSPRRLGRLSSPLSTTITTTTVSPGPPRNSPLSSVANETKIKCKWKFIAPGDRRRFRTFKYFINFLLLSSPSSPSYSSRWTVEPCRWNKWNDFNKQRNQLSFSILCRFFISRELRYIYIYRNVIKTCRTAMDSPSSVSWLFYIYRKCGRESRRGEKSF